MVFVPIDDLLPSGFVPEESEDHADLCTRGVPPNITRTNPADGQTGRRTGQPGVETESGSHRSVRALRVTLGLQFYPNFNSHCRIIFLIG